MTKGYKAQLNDDTTLYATTTGDIVIIQEKNFVTFKWFEIPTLIARLKEAQAYAESEAQK